MSVIKPLILITLFTILQNIDAQENIESVQFIDHPQKSEYISQLPGSDKHKYGYELKENKHFHHTTTEEDGVRLGCYGYVLNGKKYSTQYVADVRGYRPIYTYDDINVYPKSGEVRKASFVRNFKESDSNSQNIRYFFPEGCRGDPTVINIPMEENKMTPVIIPTPTPPTPSPPTPRAPTPTPPLPPTPKVPTPSNTKPTPPSKYLPPPITYLPPVTPAPAGNNILKAVSNCGVHGKCQSQPIKITKPPVADTCEEKCCSNDDALPKLIIPIKLDNGRSGKCGRVAQLVVPADSVGMESLKTLLSNPTELAKTIIKSLS